MSVLIRAKKVRVEGEAWQLDRMNPSQLEILQKLELIPRPEKPPKKKRGRPKGSKNKAKTTSDSVADAPKRKRGRPLGSKNKPKVSSSELAE